MGATFFEIETTRELTCQDNYSITILLPHSEPKQVQVQATALETINDIKQSLVDLPSTNQFTCFRLEYDGELLNDFAELGSLEGLPETCEFKLVETPYTEREARIHIARLIDFLGGNIATVHGGETNFDSLQTSEAGPTPLLDVDLTSPIAIDSLVVHDQPKIAQCLKSLSLSSWNPVAAQYKTRGHLLYLVLNSLEGDNIHITSSISGFSANNSTAAKFDPSMRPGTKLYHSLLPLLKALSPLFKRNYIELAKYMNSRDPILTVPVTNAHTAQPWITSNVEHKADPLRIQKSYLEQGFENNDSLRDWNEELQTTRELPVTPLPERIMRSRLLQKTLFDFSAAAAKGAELLVKGELVSLNPTEHKDAQMYIYSNIFFSRGLDGVGTFIREGGDAAAHKAVALDVNGVRILSTLDVDNLSTLGTCVVDYAGERIVAQSIVPGIFRQRAENESQIIYGGVDGRDVVATDSKCGEIFSKVSAALRLRPHAVFEKENDVRKELEMSVETKGLAGADGRTYVLDLYRLTPLDIEFLESECAPVNEQEFVSVAQSNAMIASIDAAKYPHRMTVFRYELMEAYWESKLNEYVQNKMAEEDAANSTTTTKKLEPSPSDEPAQETSATLEDKDADTSFDSDELTKVKSNVEKVESGVEKASNGQPEVNGDASNEEAKERRIDISGFKLLFNPDTFHARVPETADEEDLKKKALDEELIRDVSKFLRDVTIPKFVEDLREARTASPMDSASLSKALHKRGINIRYLGRILQIAEAEEQTAKHSALIAVAKRDVVSRATKHILSTMAKDLPFALLSSVVAHFLNCLFSTSTASASTTPELENLYPQHLAFRQLTSSMVKTQIEKEVSRRFRYSLSQEWLDEVRGLPLLREICLQFGIQLLARDFFAPLPAPQGPSGPPMNGSSESSSKKGKKGKKEATQPELSKARTTMFIPEDILTFLPIIKDSTPRSGLAEEAMEAGRMSIVQGQKDLGMELLLESLSLHEQIYGVLHPEAARGYNALALIYSSLEDKANAVELAKKAVVVAERTLGLDNSETILYYLNLALFEHANGNTKQALSYLHHALRQWHVIFGPNHPDMITTINNVAVMLQSQKLYPESLKWFESSVEICESVYGPDSVNAATLYFQIAQAMALTGDHKGSINRMRDSHNIFKTEFGEDNHNTKETHMWLSQLTQNAVQLARQAKMEASKRPPRLGNGPASLAGRTVSQPTLQNQAAAPAVAPVEERIGTKGLQSIDELVKYISGDVPATSDKKSSKKGRRPMH